MTIITSPSQLAHYEVGFAVSNLTNPTGPLLTWAIQRGRAKAVDYALWVTRLTSDGKDYWINWLLFGAPGSTSRTLP